jgi:hypothetical protein
MSLYHYRAVSDSGELQQGQLDVANEQAVLAQYCGLSKRTRSMAMYQLRVAGL